MTSLLGRNLLAELLCLACILMQFLSDGARFVRLVVPVVSLFTSVLFITCFLTFGDITFLQFVPLAVVVVPLSVFSSV